MLNKMKSAEAGSGGGGIFKKANFIQFVKFAIVGVSNTFIDWAVFFLLTQYFVFFQGGQNEILAKGISFVIAVINSFIWNSLWTFRQEFKAGLAQGEKRTVEIIYFGRFLAVSTIGLILNALVFYLARPLTDLVFARLELAQLLALVIATFAVLLWNFLANKFWTYRVKAVSTENVRRNRLVYIAVAGLLILMFVISIFVMRKDSAIVDEIAHIPAGYSYVEKQDFRLNPEHPPLAKAIASFPLMFLDLHKPFDHWSWEQINQWESGWYFLYQAGNSADLILFWSRLPMLLLTILTGLLVFKWTRKLYGARTALFVLFLFALSPSFIANGHWVTTDIAATFAFLAGIYFYNKYLLKSDRKNLIIAGLIFGLAQLLKFSAFLLIPIFVIYLIARPIIKRKEIDIKQFLKQQIWGLIQIFLIGFGLVWLVYLFFYWNTPVAVELRLIDLSLPIAGQQTFNHLFKVLAGIPVVSAFGHYLLGLFMVFAHAEGGHTAFLLGEFSRLGFKSYFPLAFLFKIPLPIIILILSSIVGLFVKKFRDSEDAWNVFVFLAVPIIYFAVSIQGKLNIGIRHLLPTLPFFYLLIARFVQPVFYGRLDWKKIALGILAVWYLMGSILAFPHYMAYFNEIRLLLGFKKHEILVDSNLDWGQDLKRLAEYCEKNNIKEIKVDYFGGGVPEYYIPQAVEWHSKYGEVKEGWLAVSATFYQMSKYFGPEEGLSDYSYLDNIKPTAVIGDSILVYYLE